MDETLAKMETLRAKMDCRGMVDLVLKRGPCADYPWSYCLMYSVTHKTLLRLLQAGVSLASCAKPNLLTQTPKLHACLTLIGECEKEKCTRKVFIRRLLSSLMPNREQNPASQLGQCLKTAAA